jgi:hypothetical protein
MLYDFTVFILASLVGNWFWELWTKRIAAKEHKIEMLKSCLNKIEHCFHELDYNSTPGIGGSRCPFTTEAQRRLLYSEEVVLLGDDLIKSLKKLIIDTGRANGEAPSVPPGSVKSGTRLLKDMLQKRSEELKTFEKFKPILKQIYK